MDLLQNVTLEKITQMQIHSSKVEPAMTSVHCWLDIHKTQIWPG